MDLFEYLIDRFGYDEVILFNEISFNNYSKIWINKSLEMLCKEKKIIRFEKGIYYIPTQTELGASLLDPYKVIEKKYLCNNGYYAGTCFLNQIGLSTQVPNTIEIFTNNESSKVRKVLVGNIPVLLRRSRISINKDNVAILSFLELMNFISVSTIDKRKKDILSSYISKYKLNREELKTYVPYFPNRVLKNLIVSDVIYLFAQ